MDWLLHLFIYTQVHFVHYNKAHGNIAQAIAKSDGLLVSGYFIKVIAETILTHRFTLEPIEDMIYLILKTHCIAILSQKTLNLDTCIFIRNQLKKTSGSPSFFKKYSVSSQIFSHLRVRYLLILCFSLLSKVKGDNHTGYQKIFQHFDKVTHYGKKI